MRVPRPGRRGLRIDDQHGTVDQLEHAAPGSESRSELLRRARECRYGFERCECEQRHGGDEHPVEPALRMRGNGRSEHSNGRQAGNQDDQTRAEPGDGGIAAGVPDEASIGLPDRGKPLLLAAVENELRRAS